MRMLIPFFFFLLLGSLAEAAVTETIDQTFPVTANAQVSIGNVNGSVTVDSWDRLEVRVIAEKRARNEDGLASMEVKITADSDRVAVKTEYRREGGSFLGFRGNAGEVKYTVTVPRGAQLRDIETVNGSIHVSGVDGQVNASSVNGTIKTSGLRHSANIETVNGSVRAEFAEIGAEGNISISSVNGKSEIVLPADAACAIKASTVNGSIRNDFGLQVDRPKYGPGNRLNGQIGEGTASIDISTVNGAIRVSKASGTM